MDTTELMDLARGAMAKAYAPYSGFMVGAAVLTENGETFTGCNVENRSYGLSVCAERVAVFKAVSEGQVPDAVAIYAEGGNSQPCGACRQVLYELNHDMKVVFLKDGHIMQVLAKELLPWPFEIDSG
jgi:cytidine deaminase